jgi:hypothetical protein
MAMPVCPNGHENPLYQRNCRQCGEKIPAPVNPVFCPSGHENLEHLTSCSECTERIYVSPQMIRWAHRYNGYKRLADYPPLLSEVVAPLERAFIETGAIPDWAGVDLLRGWAFLMVRADNHQCGNGSTLGRPFAAVVDAIDSHPATRPRERSPLGRPTETSG